MFSFLSSFGASSNFQKHRLILTTKTYDAPDQTSLKKIIQTFRGEDQQTRSQIAFATVIKKIHTSDSSDSWIYLLKNLIIFDRVVEQNCFLEEITTLNLKPIENYTQRNENAKALNSENILKTYWKLIQYKSLLLSQKSLQNSIHHPHTSSMTDSKTSKRQQSSSRASNPQVKFKKSPQHKNENGMNYDSQRSILSVLRSQKQQFLKFLSVHQIYKQSTQLETLFELIFKMIASIENDKSKIKRKRSLKRGEPNLFTQKTVFRKDFIKQNENSSLNEKLLPRSQSPYYANGDGEQNDKYKSVKEEFFNSKVVAYMHLQLLYKLLSTYSNQLICIKMFISHLIHHTGSSNQSLRVTKTGQSQAISDSDINNWKKLTINFLNFSQRIITYVQRHKNVKGFELINYQQLIPFQNVNIIGMLDEYLQHKNTLEEPDIVKVEELGTIIDVNNHIKVEKKAHWSYEKALTARKIVFPTRNLKDNNNAFHNWHNSYSSNFPPKEVLTIDLLMEMRQNPHNPATEVPTLDDDDQSIYNPFIVNRHSCIYTFRQSTISAVSEVDFVPVEEMKKKDEERLQSAVSKKTKSFYYFRAIQGDKQFQNIYSSMGKESGMQWVK